MDPEAQNDIKLSLPVIIANGEFDNRKKNELVCYGKHLIVDFDYQIPKDTHKRDQDWKTLLSDPFVKMQYHTPRGGIKVLIEHDNIDPSQHKELNLQVWDYFYNKYNIEADHKCGGLSHCHFLCYDPDASYRPNASVFNVKTQGTVKSYSRIVKTEQGSKKSFRNKLNLNKPRKFKNSIDAIQEAVSWSERRFPIVKGFRNTNLFLLSSLLSDWGVPKDFAINYQTLLYVDRSPVSQFLGDEIEKIVNSAYS